MRPEKWELRSEKWDILVKSAKKILKSHISRLISHISVRRSVVSIPLNIAEGYGRQSKEEFKRFLKISLGSSNEIEALLEISMELNYISKSEYEILSKENDEIGKMIYSMIQKWK